MVKNELNSSYVLSSLFYIHCFNFVTRQKQTSNKKFKVKIEHYVNVKFHHLHVV